MATHPLQASGEIKFSDINLELNRSSTAEIGIRNAELGGYGAISNCGTNSANRPGPGTPAAASEWYSYNHSITGSVPIWLGANGDNGEGPESTFTAACGLSAANNHVFYTQGGLVWQQSTCTSYFSSGYYRYGDFNEIGTYTNYGWVQLDGSGNIVSGPTACTTTTTTTTTTTIAGNCYTVANGAGGQSNLIYWTGINGLTYSGSIAASTTTYLCSLTTPYENPAAGVTVTTNNCNCLDPCYAILCKQQCTDTSPCP